GEVLVAVVVLGDQPYVLGELTVEPFDEVEPNDEVGDAQAFDFSSPSGFTGQIGDPDLIDNYLIPGNGTNYINVEARHNDESRFRLTLYKAGGEQYQTRSTFALGDGYTTVSDD